MKTKKSLRLRQFCLGIIAIIIALLISFFGFIYLFERHIERRFSQELRAYMNAIATNLIVGQDNQLHIETTRLNTQFNTPLSGYYWRIKDLTNGQQLYSRSLWDIELPSNQAPHKNNTNKLNSNDPHNDQSYKNSMLGNRQDGFFILTRDITLAQIDLSRKVTIDVAISTDLIDKARNEFAHDLAGYLLLLGCVFIALIIGLIEFGLWPLRGLKRSVENLMNNPKIRMSNDFYKELQPLTNTINHLLNTRARSIEDAGNRAADLAHGLKTPLAAMRNLSQRLQDAGHEETATTLDHLCRSLETSIERELARTRAKVSFETGIALCNIYDLTQQLVRVMSNTAYGEVLQWKIDLPKDASMPIHDNAMAEALGPILENASRHAKTIVSITINNQNCLMIEDDGKGMLEEQRNQALNRGIRFDERPTSTGLGLSIAVDVLDPYGYSISLDKSPLGGVKVTLGPI